MPLSTTDPSLTTNFATIMTPDPHSPEAEGEFHDYTTNRIPWYVRAVWVGFWIFAVYYTVTYLFPDLQAQKFLGQ